MSSCWERQWSLNSLDSVSTTEKRRYSKLQKGHILVRAHYVVQTTFDSGVLRLTTHRLIWDDEEQEVLGVDSNFNCVI